MNRKDFELQLQYEQDEDNIDANSYFDDEFGSLAYNSKSKQETIIMMSEIINKLDLKDEYSIKKLEIVLRHELPFFTTNRRLVRNWLMQNFIF